MSQQQESYQDFDNLPDVGEDDRLSHDSFDVWRQVNSQLNSANLTFGFKQPEREPIAPTKTDFSDSLQERIQQIRQQQKGQSPSLLEQFITDCKGKLQPDTSSIKSKPKDQYRDQEYLQYLQFKEQIHVKRLMEVRQWHEDSVKTINEYRGKLNKSVEEIVKKSEKQADDMYILLASLETELRDQLKLLQHEIVELKYRSDSKTNNVDHQQSAGKLLPNKFTVISEQLHDLMEYLNGWPKKPQEQFKAKQVASFDSVQIPQRQIIRPYNGGSPLRPSYNAKKNQGSPVSFIRRNNNDQNQLDQLIKELQQQKKTSRPNLASSPIGLDRILKKTDQVTTSKPERGRQLPGWGDLMRKSEYYSSRSKSNSELKHMKLSETLGQRKGTVNHVDRVGKALQYQSQRFYCFGHP